MEVVFVMMLLGDCGRPSRSPPTESLADLLHFILLPAFHQLCWQVKPDAVISVTASQRGGCGFDWHSGLSARSSHCSDFPNETAERTGEVLAREGMTAPLRFLPFWTLAS